ncbi:MAG: hypothetical protein K0Q48_684 [Bacillota bacterium]|jgi:hypothetical protein|nr:hypothetical protein [Bacillota bacterium]
MKDERILSVYQSYFQSEEYEEFFREGQPEEDEIEQILMRFGETVIPDESQFMLGNIKDLIVETGAWREQIGFRMGFKQGFKLACEALSK